MDADILISLRLFGFKMSCFPNRLRLHKLSRKLKIPGLTLQLQKKLSGFASQLWLSRGTKSCPNGKSILSLLNLLASMILALSTRNRSAIDRMESPHVTMYPNRDTTPLAACCSLGQAHLNGTFSSEPTSSRSNS
ncbi:unnamed protein product [Linum tenue]|uniref:Uncharacterized protein n=1 Tax=Linum tenue TaxID=586396 RepID=A0AAV0RF09_9ROSI|nr:unnamed protein product [Linum tenue]